MERFISFMTYLPSAFLTSLGLVSLTQWATLVGIVLGVLTYRLNKRHKQRIEALEQRRTELEQRRTEVIESLAISASQHNMPDVVGKLQQIARTETRRNPV